MFLQVSQSSDVIFKSSGTSVGIKFRSDCFKQFHEPVLLHCSLFVIYYNVIYIAMTSLLWDGPSYKLNIVCNLSSMLETASRTVIVKKPGLNCFFCSFSLTQVQTRIMHYNSSTATFPWSLGSGGFVSSGHKLSEWPDVIILQVSQRIPEMNWRPFHYSSILY